MFSASDFANLQRLPPAEAIAFMQGRDKTATTHHHSDLWHEEHSQQFTISRLTRADLLQAMQDSLTKSVAGDMTRRDWIKSSEKLLTNAGWWGTKDVTDPKTGEILTTRFDHARLQLIFDTNARQAAVAGQWQRMLRNQRTHPYARYVSADDARVRPLHRAWHNVTLPITDAWWDTHRPPNGYRCRCRVVGMTQRDYDRGTSLERPGAELNQDAPLVERPLIKQAPEVTYRHWRNPSTGEVQSVPAGIDPGFDYNPGTQDRSAAFEAMVQSKLAKLSPAIAQAAREARLTTGLPSETFMGQRPGLHDLPPVPVTKLTGDEFGKNLTHTEMMAQATTVLRELQKSEGLVNDDTGWLLSINRKGVKKMGDNKAQSRPSLQAIAALRELVRNAVVVERHGDDKHGNVFVKAVLRLLAPVEINGVMYRVKLTLKDLAAPDNPAKLLHALETAEIESAPLGTLLTSTDLSALQSTQPTTGRTVTIADLLRNAERSNGQPFTPDAPTP